MLESKKIIKYQSVPEKKTSVDSRRDGKFEVRDGKIYPRIPTKTEKIAEAIFS